MAPAYPVFVQSQTPLKNEIRAITSIQDDIIEALDESVDGPTLASGLIDAATKFADLNSQINSINGELDEKANATDLTSLSNSINEDLEEKANLTDLTDFITQAAVDSAIAPINSSLNNTINYTKDITVPPSKGESTFEPLVTTNGYLHVRDDDLKVVNALVSMYASGLDSSWTVDFVNAVNHYGVVENIDNKLSTSSSLDLNGKTNLMSVDASDSLYLEYIFSVKSQDSPSANLMWDVTPSTNSYTFKYIDFGPGGVLENRVQTEAGYDTNTLTVGDEHKVSAYKLGDKIFIKTTVNGQLLFPLTEFSASASMHFGFLANPNVSLRDIGVNPLLNVILPSDAAQIAISPFSLYASDFPTPLPASTEFIELGKETSKIITRICAELNMVAYGGLTLSAGDTNGKSIYMGDSPSSIIFAKNLMSAANIMAYFAVREQLKNNSDATWNGTYPDWPTIPDGYDDFIPYGVKLYKKDRTGDPVNTPHKAANNPEPEFDYLTMSWKDPDNFIESFNEYYEFILEFGHADWEGTYAHGFTVYSTGTAKLTNADFNIPFDTDSQEAIERRGALIAGGIINPLAPVEEQEAVWAASDFWGSILGNQIFKFGMFTATSVGVSNITEVPAEQIDAFQEVIKNIF